MLEKACPTCCHQIRGRCSPSGVVLCLRHVRDGRSKSVCRRGTITNWRYRGRRNNKYQTEHDDLFASIRAGKPINEGARMARTTLMAAMGRMAAYTGKEISWDQSLHSQQRLVPEKLEWGMKINDLPLAVPGSTEFI